MRAATPLPVLGRGKRKWLACRAGNTSEHPTCIFYGNFWKPYQTGYEVRPASHHNCLYTRALTQFLAMVPINFQSESFTSDLLLLNFSLLIIKHWCTAQALKKERGVFSLPPRACDVINCTLVWSHCGSGLSVIADVLSRDDSTFRNALFFLKLCPMRWEHTRFGTAHHLTSVKTKMGKKKKKSNFNSISIFVILRGKRTTCESKCYL